MSARVRPPAGVRGGRPSRARLALAAVLTVGLGLAVAHWAVVARAAGGADGPGPAAGPAGPAAPADRDRSLTTALDAVFGAGGDTWSAAAVDLTTGTTVAGGASGGMVVGSVVKVEVLETLLRVREDQGRPPTGQERDEAEAMIDAGDNDAATALWSAAGGDDALDATGRLLELTATRITTGGWFGTSTTSAADQVAVLRELVHPTFLTAGDAAYALGLMRDVEADQRWGVPNAADPGTTAAVKNGWLPDDADGDSWVADSVGVVTVGGHPVLMAVLSRHHPDLATGTAAVDRAATALRKVLTG